MSSVNFPAQLKVNPSYSEPDFILTYAQPSGCFDLLESGKPRTKIGDGDLYVYINSIDIRSEQLASQFSPSLLPSASLSATYGQTQTYNLQVRCEYGYDDLSAASNYSVSLPQALDFANQQGIYQGLRSMLLYGLTPGNGEGLINTVGATAVTLPPDSYGNTTVQTYDNGEMALWFLQQVTNLVVGLYQTGNQQKGKIVILSPQRVFMQFQLANVVQLTSYQRPGAGTGTTASMIQDITQKAGYELEWYYDDTLEGKGAGGADMVILSMPEIETPTVSQFSTNKFGETKPHLNAVNLMYTDMAAPMKIPTPVPDGALTEIQRIRATCGWCVRPQGLFLLSLPY